METQTDQIGLDNQGLNQQGLNQQGLKDQAVSQVRTLAGEAKTTVQDRLRTTATSGKTSAAVALSGIAQSLSTTGQQLNNEQNGIGKVVEHTAESLSRAASFLETTQVDEMLKSAEGWARRKPALFLGGAFAIGLLSARFMKSTPPENAGDTGSTGLLPAGVEDREIAVAPVAEGI